MKQSLNLDNEETFLEKAIKKVSIILPIIPFLLIIWILYQFSFLIWINKTPFFSWSQVINDTSILFFPLVSWISWFLLANEIDPLKKQWFWKDFLGLIFITTVIYFVFYGLLSKLLWNAFILWSLSNLIWTSIIYIKINYLWSQNMKSKNAIKFMKIVLFLLMFSTLFNFIRESQFSNLYIKNNDGKHKIDYMNDKYIFMSGSIIRNTEDIIFQY